MKNEQRNSAIPISFFTFTEKRMAEWYTHYFRHVNTNYFQNGLWLNKEHASHVHSSHMLTMLYGKMFTRSNNSLCCVFVANHLYIGKWANPY